MHLFIPNKLNESCDTSEAELLLLCARVQLDAERVERIGFLLCDGLDWDLLLALALRNGLLPLLSFHLAIQPAPIEGRSDAEKLSDLIPPERLEYLRDYFRKNKAFNVLLTGELLHLLKLFEGNDIQALPYKGPAVAVGVYGDLALRQFCDLDILVRERDVWKATELLIEQGFEAHFEIPVEKQAAFTRLGYVRLFRKDAGRTIIELHWRIAPRFLSVSLDTNELWTRLKSIELQRTQVLAPAAEDLLLMFAVHGAKDFWEKLEWVCGIAELLRANPNINWDRLLHDSQQLHCERMLLVALSLAQRLFDSSLPPPVIARLKSSRLDAIVSDIAARFLQANAKPMPFSKRILFHLKFKDRLRDRVRYCTRLALTTTPIDWAASPLPRPLTFLHLPLRAVRLAKRYGLAARGAHVWLLPIALLLATVLREIPNSAIDPR